MNKPTKFACSFFLHSSLNLNFKNTAQENLENLKIQIDSQSDFWIYLFNITCY